jgi:Dynamin family
MDQFDTRRQGLLGAIQGLRSLAEFMAPADNALQDLLGQAHTLVEQSAVNLVVLGAEGHGKSSLVDAVLGADVVPREAQHPGTVAPIIVQWHDAEAPKYAVGFNGSDAPTPCEDAEQFRRFILQRFNPNNERGVGHGLVEYRHPLLVDGLRLVDMPGLEGVSTTVNAALRQYVAQADAVIIVIRDRQYGAAVRLLEAFGERDVHVQAVISNWSLDFWVSGSDAELAERIDAQRAIVADYLSTDQLAIDPQRVFVLHVPSMSNCALAADAMVSRAPHMAEIERFGAWLTHYLDADHVTGLLNETVTHLRQAITLLQQRVDRHARTLDHILAGDTDTQRQILLKLRSTADILLSQWPQLAAPDEMEALAARHWTLLAGSLRECREAVLAAVNQAQADLPSADRWGHDTLTRLAQGLRATVEDAAQQLEQSHSDAILAVVERLRAVADLRIAETLEIAPVVPGRLDAVHVEGASFVDFTHPSPEPERFLEIFSERRIADRILASYRAQAQAIDSTRRGPQGQAYDRNVQAARDAFREAMRRRLRQKDDAIADPTSGALTEGRQLLADVYNNLENLAADLSSLATTEAPEAATRTPM